MSRDFVRCEEESWQNGGEHEPPEPVRTCRGCKHWSVRSGTIGLVMPANAPMYLVSLCRLKPRRKNVERRTRETNRCDEWEPASAEARKVVE